MARSGGVGIFAGMMIILADIRRMIFFLIRKRSGRDGFAQYAIGR